MIESQPQPAVRRATPRPRRAPRERPLIFSAAMIRALLAGAKTQTRRVVGHAPEQVLEVVQLQGARGDLWDFRCDGAPPRAIRCPHGEQGDRIWVREVYAYCTSGEVLYRATIGDRDAATPWRTPLFMPRSASRMTLEVTEVRVEPLQEISEDDARAEGVEPGAFGNHRAAYTYLWEAIHEERAPWVSNPWVWAISFRRVTP